MKRLTVAEQDERRRLGLCFNCDEKYFWGHNRVCRHLFFIGGVELSDADKEDAAPALEAPVSPCMRWQVYRVATRCKSMPR